ncbi:uncharacterized protein LAJ45_03768 [Morchella importuna]|uniref:uncharacterized protein n=1 Tax=Morchella importuna TaxID=1174673 RepID=UPI001E8CF352|nr:uncharacterized protein LAJ45_03768 [Morchella importuna]KAH8152341.1 hypothetical protein LAJ45_03768 [Morchella importuna]
MLFHGPSLGTPGSTTGLIVKIETGQCIDKHVNMVLRTRRYFSELQSFKVSLLANRGYGYGTKQPGCSVLYIFLWRTESYSTNNDGHDMRIGRKAATELLLHIFCEYFSRAIN